LPASWGYTGGHRKIQIHKRTPNETYPGVSHRPSLAMGAKAYEFEAVVIRLAVDENEVRPDVAVAIIAPFAGQRVIEIPARQRRVGGEQVNDLHEQCVQLLAVPTGLSRL
jgi:hypothetical protein